MTVIGSRSATVDVACCDLSKQGVCIVSGLAVGIDAVRTMGAWNGRGSPTMA